MLYSWIGSIFLVVANLELANSMRSRGQAIYVHICKNPHYYKSTNARAAKEYVIVAALFLTEIIAMI
jgi:hypothetical protein